MTLLVDKLKQIELGDSYAPTVEKHIKTLEGVIEAKAIANDPQVAVAKLEAGEMDYRAMNMLASELIKSSNNGEAVSPELAATLGKALDAQLADVPNKGMNMLVLPNKLGSVAELYFLGGNLDQAIATAQKAMDIHDKNIEKVEAKNGEKATQLLKLMRRGTKSKLKRYEQEKSNQQDGVADDTDAA